MTAENCALLKKEEEKGPVCGTHEIKKLLTALRTRRAEMFM